MKFCIVSPPTVTEFGRNLAESEVILRLAEHAPVGILTLAAVLDELGRPPEIVDLNQIYYDYLRSTTGSEADFCTYAVNHLMARDFDVAGFGTICSSYPLTLRLARALKQRRPGVRILLGGPQASVVDVPTLESFSYVDYIVRFEAEETLPRLLEAIERDEDPGEVAGITFRRGGGVVRTASPPVIEDLDRLPLPAYSRYPYLRQARYIPLELGRGCPYACTFCSTNDFFRRKFRLKSPSLIVEQMARLKKEFGIAVFDLIHDMFTVDRSKVVEFCQALLASGEKFYWNCSARTDRVDDELLELMAGAGCRGIFFGIETGSQSLQKTIKKRLILSDALARVRAASDHGLRTAASLITGFPDETPADFADTADFFVQALRYENTVPQLHILAPLADTPIHREYRDRLAFDDIISDMSHQGWEQDPADRELIAAHPDIFANFYAVPTPLDRTFVKEVRGFLLSGTSHFRYLLVALHQEQGHILQVFREFQDWRDQHGAPPDPAARAPYYQGPNFRGDFLRFVRARYLEGDSPAAPALAAIVSYETSFDDVAVEDPTTDLRRDTQGAPLTRMTKEALLPSSVPRLAPNVRMLEVDVDYQALMESLVERRSLGQVPRNPQRLASRKLPGNWPEVLQLSPLSTRVLDLCDGRRTVEEIGREMARLTPELQGVPVDKACLVGLELLRHDHLIEDLAASGQPA
jgi:radical SAM superfamily enzyme YgiQ (UPF0313 family)